MLLLRYLAVVAIALWVGGLIALGGIAAPSVFETLGATGADGRGLAGAVFGETLRRFHLVSYVCGGVIIASLLARAILGPRPRRFAIRMTLAALMLAASASVGLIIAPEIRAAQASGTSPSTLPDGDPARVRFGRLHGLSSTLALVPVLAGLALLFLELRE
jgi:putative copper export protein